MFSSIRWTLLLWQAAILVAALVLFGTALDAGASHGRMHAVDDELESAARAVVARLLVPPPRPATTRAAQPPPRWEEMPHGLPHDWATKIPADFLTRPGLPDADQPYFAVRAADGFVFARSARAGPIVFPTVTRPSDNAGRPDPTTFRTVGGAREVLINAPVGATVLVGRFIVGERRLLANMRWVLFGVGSTVLLVGLLGSWALATRVTAPIRAMGTAAAAIATADGSSPRLPLPPPRSELAPLAHALNESFDRLRDAYDRQARFTADASHELRTPLAVIRSQAELALRRPRSADEYRRPLEACLRAAGRMGDLVDSLLLLATTDAGRPAPAATADLAAVARDAAAALAPLAAERSVTVRLDLAPATVAGDAAQMSRVVGNLLSNALRYNQPGGTATVTVSAATGGATLVVTDTGVGIAAADLPRLFERFFRADAARSRDTGGSGLGLAICQGIVHAHRGTIAVDSAVGQGTRVTVALPLAGL